jgi:hypothetical protein
MLYLVRNHFYWTCEHIKKFEKKLFIDFFVIGMDFQKFYTKKAHVIQFLWRYCILLIFGPPFKKQMKNEILLDDVE